MKPLFLIVPLDIPIGISVFRVIYEINDENLVSPSVTPLSRPGFPRPNTPESRVAGVAKLKKTNSIFRRITNTSFISTELYRLLF